MIRKQLSLALMPVLVFSCATMPQDTDLPTQDEITNEMVEQWESSTQSPIDYVNVGRGVIASSPEALPDDIYNQHFKVSFSETMKLSNLHAFLKPEGLTLVIPDEEVRNKALVIHEFDGKLGDFLRAVGIAYGINFNWHPGNIITAEATSQYVIKVPQDEELMSEVATAIESLGALEVGSSLSAGSINYQATYDAHQRITHYIDEIAINAAVITLQAAIVTVSLDRNRETGFDWSKLQAKVGDFGIDEGGFGFTDDDNSSFEPGTVGDSNSGGEQEGEEGDQPSGATDAEGDGGSDNAQTPVNGTGQSIGVNMRDTRTFSSISQQGAGVLLKKGDMDVRAVIRLLSTYGRTETTQSVLMKTLSGKPVTLDSSQQIPYVAEIGRSLGFGNNTGVNGFANSRVQINDLDVGLMFELSPYFDAHSGLVTVGVDVELSSLISFIEISAGNDVGNITRPNTQKQSFTDMLRMMPGESVIIGGLMYNQMSDNRSSLAPLDRLPIAGKARSSTRNALFILLRPTVTVYGDETQLARLQR